jgi:TolB-like protein/Flp pilus assembly protein TadD
MKKYVIDRALAKDPADRYQSMPEMMLELQQVAQAIGLVGSKVLDDMSVPHVPLHRERLVGRWWRWTQNRKSTVSLFLAAGLIMVGLVVWQWPRQPPSPTLQPPGPIKSMAVLPFKPLVADNRNEALELGMADTLIFRLSSIRGIVVRPISAVRKYVDLNQDPLAAGREQRVDAVLDSSIQMVGEKIRVTARLVRVEDGSVLWADKYDQQYADLFTVQDAIAEKLARSLALNLTDKEKQRLTKRYTDNAEAYQLYLKGCYFWNKGSGDGFKKAIEFFEQAIKLDPTYAPAYAWLADAFAMSARFRIMPQREANAKAKAAALKALELDGELAKAHVALGEVNLFYDWDWPAAEENFKRAIALEPNEPRAHQAYAVGLACLGRFDEAMRVIQRARELDPVSLEVNTSLAMILYFARRYDQAISEAREALELDPNAPVAHRFLGKASVERGLYDEAIAAFRKGIVLGGPALLKADLGHAYAVSGRRSEALKILDELKDSSERNHGGWFDAAIVYVGLGETDPALKWLEKSYAERERHIVALKVSPVFDPLRSDPRFQDLLRRVGLWQ